MRFLFSRGLTLGAIAVVVIGLAAGGIAYASIPDSSRIIHGCFQKTNGQLRVIDSDKGQSCNPSENGLNWNQTGPKGATGAAGSTGSKGPTGPQGPGASTFVTTLPEDQTYHTLVTLDNGLTVKGICSTFSEVGLDLEVTPSSNGLQASGTASWDIGSVDHLAHIDYNDNVAGTLPAGDTYVDLDVLARNGDAGGKFARIDVHGSFGSPCTFWGMTIPSG
jgi:hypothetical protein